MRKMRLRSCDESCKVRARDMCRELFRNTTPCGFGVAHRRMLMSSRSVLEHVYPQARGAPAMNLTQPQLCPPAVPAVPQANGCLVSSIREIRGDITRLQTDLSRALTQSSLLTSAITIEQDAVGGVTGISFAYPFTVRAPLTVQGDVMLEGGRLMIGPCGA